MPTIQPNTYVTLDYTLHDEQGELLDASTVEGGEPIRYVHGYGMLVPGLEAALAGLSEGDEKKVVVSAEEGYGEYDDELVLELERTEFPDPAAVEVGDEFVAEGPDGEEVAMEVIEVRDDVVVVDANHPLAGMQLHYEVKVQSIRTATDEEIQEAAAEFEAAQAEMGAHEHGEDCGCGDAPEENLVSLGKKKPDLLN
jgi:FKBP-type peptidyl-prolyl cis-trans isomerase SlyD